MQSNKWSIKYNISLRNLKYLEKAPQTCAEVQYFSKCTWLLSIAVNNGPKL